MCQDWVGTDRIPDGIMNARLDRSEQAGAKGLSGIHRARQASDEDRGLRGEVKHAISVDLKDTADPGAASSARLLGIVSPVGERTGGLNHAATDLQRSSTTCQQFRAPEREGGFHPKSTPASTRAEVIRTMESVA